MKVRYWLIPLVVVLCLCVGFALLTRCSFTEITERQYKEVKLIPLGDMHPLNGPEVASFQDCVHEAEAIVIVRYDGRFDFSTDALYEKVQVEKVLKGENVPEEFTFVQQIGLICNRDWAFFNRPKLPLREALYIAGSQLPLREGRQYLLLLQKVDYHPKRVLPEAMKDPYYALGDTTVGIYEISDRVQTRPLEEGTTLATLPEDALILTMEQEELDLYNQFRQDALAWLEEVS